MRFPILVINSNLHPILPRFRDIPVFRRRATSHPYSTRILWGFGHPFFIHIHPRFIFISSLYHLLSSFRSSSIHLLIIPGHLHNHPLFIFTIIFQSSHSSSLHHPSVISHTSSTILSKSNYNSSNYYLTIFYFLNKSSLHA